MEKIPLSVKATKYKVGSTWKIKKLKLNGSGGSYRTLRNGTGRHVKRAVIRRNIFLPKTSDKAPIRGAYRKLRNPLTPITTPFMRRAWF